MKEWNTTLDGFREPLTDCILIYERAMVVTLLHKLVPFDQASKYFSTMANMWEFVDVGRELVPPKPRWPCLDTNSVTTIVYLPSQPINPGHTFLISLTFSLPVNLFHFQSFFKFFNSQWSKESLLVHMAKDLEAFAST